MKRLLKKLSFVVLLLAIVFVPALLISASGAISVKVSTYTSETNPTITNVSRDLGFRQSITTPGGTTFAYFALNGFVSEKLVSDYQFPVRTKTEIDAYYHPAGQFVVIFADSNNKVLDVKYVTSGQTVSVTAANTAAATLVKYGMTLNGESTRWKTSDNIGPEVAITSNRIFYAQYTVTNVNTYNLTVTGGTGSGTFSFNQVATATANTPSEGNVFSHWEDAEGNVLSTKSVYKFTMYKTMAVTAVFAAEAEYQRPVVNMSDAIVLRDNSVSYLGQFDLPAGFEFIESGFLFSRSSMVLEKTSLGVTVAQSNVHNSTTKEYLMTFSDTLFNSIRAYVTVKRTSDSVIFTYYSENVYRNPNILSQTQVLHETIDFESASGFTASTTYNNTTINYQGPTSKQWGFFFGTPSTTGPIAGTQSGQLRYYTATPSDLGIMFMDYDIANISKVVFKALNTSGNNVRVQYSKDGGTSWTGDETFTLGTSSSSFTYNISEFGASRVRFVLVPGSTNGSRVTIDDVQIFKFTEPTPAEVIHEVVLNNENALTTKYIYNAEVVSAPSVSKTGYTLDGWFTDVAKTIQYNFSTPVQQSFTLYAKWSINQYTISFDSNSGSAVSPLTQNYNTAVSAPADPTKTGHDFGGWYSDSGLTQTYTFSTMPAGNITLYAKWNVKQYTISFNSNDGSSVSAITQNFGTNVSAPADPIKEGYSFKGWFTDTELTQEYSFTTMPANSFTLYAKWEELMGTYYTVTFNSNGGSLVSSQQVLSGGKATLPNPAPTRNGYTFFRWETEGNVAWNFDSTISAAITLFATWNTVTYTITYSNLELTTHSNPATYNIETSTFALTNPTAREGYNFTGWFTESTGGTQVTTINVGSTGNRTLYARWESTTPEPELLYSYDFLDGGSSSNSAYANTDLATNVSFAPDNPGGTSGTTAWIASYANLSLTNGTRLGGKLTSIETGANNSSANIRTNFTYENNITKVEIFEAVKFGTLGNVGSVYLQTSTDGVTWTTVSSKTVTSTITFDSLDIQAGRYIRILVAITASGTNSGLQFTKIQVTGYPN